MAAPARSAYPDVDKALQKFETYVQQLPVVTSLPQSPNACAPIDANQFAGVAAAMRQLPVCTVPQLVNAALRNQIESLQARYRRCLLLCEQKGVISSAASQAISKSVAGQSVDNQRSNSTQGASSQAARQSSSANKGFFAFNENSQVSLGKQPENRSGSIFTRVFGKRMPA